MKILTFLDSMNDVIHTEDLSVLILSMVRSQID